MGYYHGYKGYRYCGSPNQILLYTDFKQIKAVYDFDMKIKSIFYPQIMFLETTIKNYSLEIILNEVNSDRFVDVYTKLMNNYKSYPFNSKKYKIAITKKMSMRNKIYGNIARDYGKNNIINVESNMSRLNVKVKDTSIVNKDGIEKLGAKGIVEIDNELKTNPQFKDIIDALKSKIK